MKTWKESNMNMIKESINTFIKFNENCDKIPKKGLFLFAPLLTEKIGDTKYYTNIIKLLEGACAKCTPKFVAQQMVKSGINGKVPKNLEKLCEWLTTTLGKVG